MALINGRSRRFFERQESSLTLTVKCFESEGEWEENTNLIDVTRSGARFVLTRKVETGQPLHLSLPMPRNLRSYDLSEKEYKIWAIARYVIEVQPADETGDPHFRIGVAFIGKSPPAGFLMDMTKRYELKLRPSGDGMWDTRERPRRELF